MNFSWLEIVLVCFLVALNTVLTEGPPRKLEAESNRQIIFAHINETVTLKCPVESTSEFMTYIDWTKGNTSLYLTPGYEITNKGYLKIKSVTWVHSGIYTCEAINGYGSVRVNLTLVVDNSEVQNETYNFSNRNSGSRIHFTPPIITKRPSSLAVDLGEQATFHCMASGQPVPKIFWLKDGHLIQGASTHVAKRKAHSTLKLKDLSQLDSGTYTCIARNNVGEDEMDFSLDVTEPSPPPRILALDPPTVTIQEGASIAFVCEVSISNPGVQVHIKWLKRQDGTRELPDDINLFRSGKLYYRPLNLSNSENVINKNVYKSKLLIRNSREADSGTYVCLALNDKGFNYKNSTLKVIGESNTFASTSHNFSISNTPLVVTVSVVFVFIIAVLALLSQICCKIKSENKLRNANGRTPLPNVETGSIKHSMTSIKTSNKDYLSSYPEAVDPQSSSKLLAINSAFLPEHEMQVTKSFHTRTFH